MWGSRLHRDMEAKVLLILCKQTSELSQRLSILSVSEPTTMIAFMSLYDTGAWLVYKYMLQPNQPFLPFTSQTNDQQPTSHTDIHTLPLQALPTYLPTYLNYD